MKELKAPVWWAVVPLLLLAFWLGARGINADALWYDEWLSVYYAGGAQYGPAAPAEIWTRVAARSTWPPGFQSMLAMWGAAVGWTHAAMRVLPLLIGVLAVAWLYRLGRDLRGQRVGLYAALALGASAFFGNYLHELRGYTLYALFSTLHVWAYLHIAPPGVGFRRRGGLGMGLLFFGSVVGLLYTHYFATLTAVVVALYHMLIAARRLFAGQTRPPAASAGSAAGLGLSGADFWRQWWRVPILMGLAGVTFIPWALMAFTSTATTEYFESGTRRVPALSAAQATELLVYTFSNASVALFVILAVFALRSRGRGAVLVGFWTAALLAISLAINERLQIVFHVRHLLALYPPLALVVALGMVEAGRAGLRPALLGAVWIGAALVTAGSADFINRLPPNPAPIIAWDGLEAALDVLSRRGDDDDAAVFHVITAGREWLTEPVIAYYADALPMAYTQHEQIPGVRADDVYLRAVFDWLDNADRVWTAVVPDVPSDYHVGEFDRALAQRYTTCGRVLDLPTMQLDLWTKTPDPAEAAPYRFEVDGEALIGLRLLEEPVTVEDGHAVLVFGWSADAAVAPDLYSVAVHVEDARGTLVAQTDASLPTAAYACRQTLVNVAALAPGDYTVRVGVYAWQTGERLSSVRWDGRESERPVVATLTVP